MTTTSIEKSGHPPLPCQHNHATNFDWATSAAYPENKLKCFDCGVMFQQEPLPVYRAELQAQVLGLAAALRQIAELEGDSENQKFKLTRFQAAQVARLALTNARAVLECAEKHQ